MPSVWGLGVKLSKPHMIFYRTRVNLGVQIRYYLHNHVKIMFLSVSSWCSFRRLRHFTDNDIETMLMISICFPGMRMLSSVAGHNICGQRGIYLCKVWIWRDMVKGRGVSGSAQKYHLWFQWLYSLCQLFQGLLHGVNSLSLLDSLQRCQQKMTPGLDAASKVALLRPAQLCGSTNCRVHHKKSKALWPRQLAPHK